MNTIQSIRVQSIRAQSIRALKLPSDVTSYLMVNYWEFERLKPYLFNEFPRVSSDTVPSTVSILYNGELCGVSDPRISKGQALTVLKAPPSGPTKTLEIRFDDETVYFCVHYHKLIDRLSSS